MTVLEAIQKSTEFLGKKGVDSPRLQTELLILVGALAALAIAVMVVLFARRLSGSLRAITSDLDAASRHTVESSQQVSSSSQSLAQGASEQAASLEETSSTLEEISSMTQRNSESVERAEQLALSSRYKSEFLANMSHELRTPLNSMLILAKLLSDNPGGNLSARQVEYARTILAAGTDLLSLINDILDLTKVEAGRMELELSTFDLATAISNAMTLVRERAQRHGITLGFAGDQGAGEIVADERKFKQILLNLLGNSMKFTEKGGLTVRAERDPESAVPGGLRGGAGGAPAVRPALTRPPRARPASGRRSCAAGAAPASPRALGVRPASPPSWAGRAPGRSSSIMRCA